MQITKIIPKIIFIIISILFIIFPYPNADLLLRIHYIDSDQFTTTSSIDGTYALYYSTENPYTFSPEQIIFAEIDTELQQITFRLDSSLAGKLKGLRLDFPNAEKLICINNITVSSAGIIQKQFNPCNFFDDINLLQKNDINAISLSTALNRTYIQTGNYDPYLILSDNLVTQISNGYSSYRLTRLGICLFIFAVFFLKKKKIFSEDMR